jgi:Peptidase family M1 domain
MLRTFWSTSILLMAVSTFAQTPIQTPSRPIEPSGAAKQPNSEGTYQALRGSLPSGDGVSVKDFTLEREGGVFHFDQGDFYFYGPINGLVTGAVFTGKGHFSLTVKDASEQRSLALLTKSGVMQQDFTSLVLRFTDATADEIRKASTGSPGKAPTHEVQVAADLAKSFRKRLNENLELHLLPGVLAAQPGHFFLASFRMGGAFTGRNVLFEIDPEGAYGAAPDEVALSTWDDSSYQTWAAYRMAHPDPKATGVPTRVTEESLDVTFEKSGTMHSSAETTLTLRRDGVRVVRLELYPTLRVSGVFSDTGAPLDFVQEAKDADPQFAIILPAAAKAGQTIRLLTRYAGPEALRRDGEDVYDLLARESWYPAGLGQLGDFANFRMTFHMPKNLQIVATGKQVSLTPEDKGMVRAVWATDAPIPVAGFNLGAFKSKEEKTADGFVVDAYADITLPDAYAPLAQSGVLGTMTTVSALPNEVSQGRAAVQIYTDFFGKLPYDHLALTQQSACNFGQSWPMLVYLPTCAFWDSTIKHELGLLDFGAKTYWEEVTPHEVAHQWWGQLVGFSSYRDQWMSEGFATFSAGVFLLNTNPKMDQYRDYWNEQKKNLLEKNKMGMRPIDVGPLTMGYRANNEKTGNVYQLLIYSKGAYVLHMLEMMYYNPTVGQTPFKRSMHQFVTDYAGKAATTEDWKASMEKTMPKNLDLAGNGKLDWFFNEYVYGTELPHYTISSEFTVGADGVTSVHMKLAQSNVSKDFMMLVPLYLAMDNGNTVLIGKVPIHGNDTVDKTLVIGKLPAKAKTLVLNYNADVLSD